MAAAEEPEQAASEEGAPAQRQRLQPVMPESVRVPLGTREHAARLLAEMGRKMEGMDSPLSRTNPWASVSSEGLPVAKLPNGEEGQVGTDEDPYNAKFGHYVHPTRGVPPPAMYNTLLFDPKNPFRREAKEQTDPRTAKTEKWYTPLHESAGTNDQFPAVAVPIPVPLPRRRPYDTNGLGRDRRPSDWMYEPVPYRPRVVRPDRLPKDSFGRSMPSYTQEPARLVNPRSMFTRHAPAVGSALAQAAAGSTSGAAALIEEGASHWTDPDSRTFSYSHTHHHRRHKLTEAEKDAREEREELRTAAAGREHGKAAAAAAREFRFASVHTKDGWYPVGRLGATRLRGPASNRLKHTSGDWRDVERRRDMQSVRDASVADRTSGRWGGPYGHGYNTQPGGPRDGRGVVESRVEPSPPKEQADYRFAQGPPLDRDAAAAEKGEEPPRPYEQAPTPDQRPFPTPAKFEVTKTPQQVTTFVSVASTAATHVRAEHRLRKTVYGSSHRRAPPAAIAPGAVPAAAPPAPAEKEAAAEAEKAPVPAPAPAAAPERKAPSPPPSPMLLQTADAVAHPKKPLRYELPMVRRVPKPRPVEYVPSGVSVDAVLVERAARAEANAKAAAAAKAKAEAEAKAREEAMLADGRPWWEHPEQVKANAARIQPDRVPTTDKDATHLPMPGTFGVPTAAEQAAAPAAAPAAPASAPAPAPAMVEQAASAAAHLPVAKAMAARPASAAGPPVAAPAFRSVPHVETDARGVAHTVYTFEQAGAAPQAPAMLATASSVTPQPPQQQQQLQQPVPQAPAMLATASSVTPQQQQQPAQYAYGQQLPVVRQTSSMPPIVLAA